MFTHTLPIDFIHFELIEMNVCRIQLVDVTKIDVAIINVCFDFVLLFVFCCKQANL